MSRRLRRRYGRSTGGVRDTYRGVEIRTQQGPHGGWSYGFEHNGRTQTGGRRTGYTSPWKAIVAGKDHVDQVMR